MYKHNTFKKKYAFYKFNRIHNINAMCDDVCICFLSLCKHSWSEVKNFLLQNKCIHIEWLLGSISVFVLFFDLSYSLKSRHTPLHRNSLYDYLSYMYCCDSRIQDDRDGTHVQKPQPKKLRRFVAFYAYYMYEYGFRNIVYSFFPAFSA